MVCEKDIKYIIFSYGKINYLCEAMFQYKIYKNIT